VANDPTAYFADPVWQPLCAVGSHGADGQLNAQICISISGASIVPEKPRLLVALWKQNLTHDLVMASGTLCVSILHAGQLDSFETLGLRTGREGPKLAGIAMGLTASRDPYLLGSVGYADCVIADSMDLGDCSVFLALCRDERRLTDKEPITWADAERRLPDGVIRRYEQKFESDRQSAGGSMRWLQPGLPSGVG
jgi:flavin reductase (DIM6/NTAB) family NADH-FMN oxidoreductase RutF